MFINLGAAPVSDEAFLKKGLVTRHRFQVGVREPLSQSGPLLSDTPFGAYVAL
jgi:hypothetical protein